LLDRLKLVRNIGLHPEIIVADASEPRFGTRLR